MFKRLLSMLITIVFIFLLCSVNVVAKTDLFKIGKTYCGFQIIDIRYFSHLKSDIITLKHKKTDAEVIICSNDDINKTFEISFKTPLLDDKGLTHVLEHAILSGSEKYPSSTLTMKLKTQTFNTVMSGETFKYNTVYPISSLSEDQLYSLSNYYLDSVFNPLLLNDKTIFDREAWHYELENSDDDINISGTCYTEVQGYDTLKSREYYNIFRAMYPEGISSRTPNGDKGLFLTMNHDDLIKYYMDYYHPSNSLTVLYGNMDYERFLSLLNKYFNQYEKKEFNSNIGLYAKTKQFIEQTYDYPVSLNYNGGASSTYCIECVGANSKDVMILNILSAIMNDESGDFQQRIKSELPDTNIYCWVSSNDSPYPLFCISSDSIDIGDYHKMMDITNIYLMDALNNEIDSEIKEAIVAAMRRNNAKSFESATIGKDIANNISKSWARGDIYSYFDMLDCNMEEIIQRNGIENIIKKYLNGLSRSALVTTVPVKGLLEQEQEKMRQRLVDKKSSMTDIEIQDLVNTTKEYHLNMQQYNEEIDKKFLTEISIVDLKSLPEELRDYNITDTYINNVRYITSIANIEDIGKGRIMLDVSDLPVEDIHWLSLYQKLLGNMPTEMYDAEGISIRASRYADCSTDIVTITAENQSGFTPYLIFKYEGFSDESHEIFDAAEQILFKSDFSNIERLKNIVDWYINSMEQDIEQNSYYYLLLETRASGNNERAYYNEYEGLTFYQFLKDVKTCLDVNPDKVTKKLNEVKEKLHNRNGAAVVYSGEEKSVAINTKIANNMFGNIPYKEKSIADYSMLKTDSKNRAMPINLNVNFNGISESLAQLGIDFSMKTEVILNCITDRYFIPELRNKYNVYGFNYASEDSDVSMMTYRDPNIKETFDFYSNIGNMMRSDNISQDEIENYGLRIYSKFTMPRGELHDAYWSAADYMDGVSPDIKKQMLKDIKSITVEDYYTYSDIFDNIGKNGLLFTAGMQQMIEDQSERYDNIILPFVKDNISIFINGEKIETDCPALIENNITMVPMRPVFEKLGAEVIWNEKTQEVVATKDKTTISFLVGSNIIKLSQTDNSHDIQADCDIYITNNRTMIPLRIISELFDYNVYWDEDNKIINII